MNSLEFNKNRLFFIYFCISAGFIALIIRLLFIVILNDDDNVGNIYSTDKNPKRSDIVDRNGVIVATDLDIKLLYCNNTLIRNPQYVAKKLSETFSNLEYQVLLKKLTQSKDGWVLIRRNITPKQEKLINNLNIAGLIFEDSKVRIYPQQSSLSHILGYTDLDNKGLAGIEKEYDDFLSASSQDLKLATDIRIQEILNHELKKAIIKFKAEAAFGIIMNVKNGEILALSSLPNFDPNNQGSATNNEKFNKATYGVYELGSVFKIFNHALAFENNLIESGEIFDIKKAIKFGRFKIDDDHKDKDKLTTEEVFTESSNIGSVRISQRFEKNQQKEFLDKIGLLQKINTDFPSLGTPIYPKRWGKIRSATISFGHGIAVTPLHLVTAVSAILNDGKLINPSFIKTTNNPEFKQVISPSTSKIMRGLMEQTVEIGTGKNTKIKHYKIGGKTGTAEMAEKGKYNKNKTLASFVSSFPINDPKYIIYVGIDRPNYIFNTGGMVAAPVTKNIIINILPIIKYLK